MTRLVLASASPARLATLRAAGGEPSVVVSDIDEDEVSGLAPAALAQHLAELKCAAVAAQVTNGSLVLGCDSLLELDGEAHGKPEDPEQAAARWRAMRGRSGTLHTGHCLRDTASGREAAATGSTVVHFADVTDDEIAAERERFMRRRGLDDDAALERWLADNDLEPGELTELVGAVALCRRLHGWYMVANWMERTTRLVLDELRLDGRYPEWADRAAAQERVLRSRPDLDEHDPVRLSLDELVESHREWTGRRLPVPARVWAEEAGFHTPDNLRAALKRSRTVRTALLQLLAAATPGAAD
jgi:septum formation protein